MKKPLKIGMLISASLIFKSPLVHAEIPETKDDYKISLSTSYNYSSGDYGQSSNTDITYVPVTAKVKYENIYAKLVVPYISMTGPGTVVGGGDIHTVGTAGVKRTESGLGDVVAVAGYTLPLSKQSTLLDLSAELKLPTADKSKKLGTGTTDYSLLAGVTQPVGNAFFTAKGGRKFYGSSDQYSFKDVWKYSLGAGYSITPDITVGTGYDYRQASSAGSKPFSQAIGYAVYNITKDVAAQIYAGGGFTNASPNFTSGFQLTYKFAVSGS